jgi:hypothetical protein
VTGFVRTISDLIPVGVNRNVILLGCNFDGSVSSVSDAFDAIRQRKKFIQSCPNLESLKDETRELGYIMNMTLPSTLSTLFVHLKMGEAPAKPIKAPGLSSLIITADLTLRESPYNFEVFEYSTKVLDMCRDIVRLDHLSLQLPGLRVHPVPHGLPQPLGDKVEDMLPATLKSIGELQIQLPFCSPEPGHPRESHAVSRRPVWASLTNTAMQSA